MSVTRLEPVPTRTRRPHDEPGPEGPEAPQAPDRSWGQALLLFDASAHAEPALDDDELSQLRHRLVGAIDDLVDRIAAIKAVRRRPGGRTADAVDSVLADRVTVHERRLEDTTAALAAIDAGAYGRCLRCRHAIGMAALWADPVSTCCLGCVATAD